MIWLHVYFEHDVCRFLSLQNEIRSQKASADPKNETMRDLSHHGRAKNKATSSIFLSIVMGNCA